MFYMPLLAPVVFAATWQNSLTKVTRTYECAVSVTKYHVVRSVVSFVPPKGVEKSTIERLLGFPILREIDQSGTAQFAAQNYREYLYYFDYRVVFVFDIHGRYIEYLRMLPSSKLLPAVDSLRGSE